MFIKNDTLRDLIAAYNGEKEIPRWLIPDLLDDLDRSDKREAERKRIAREKRMAFCRKLYDVLAEEPGRKLCPTDIQFILYRRNGEQLSCQKIASTLFRMVYVYPRWDENWPKGLQDIKRSDSYSCNDGHRDSKDAHSYYYIEK